MQLYTLPLGMLQTNCYILADEATGKALIIDAPDRADVIISFLEEHNLKAQEIILTHGHYDHILALKQLKEKLNIPVAIHENGEAFLKDTVLNLMHYAGLQWEPVQADRYLKDNDRIQLGETELTVLHTPGHTSDCICLLSGDTLISGDTLFMRSIGRIDHPTGSMQQEIASIKEKLLVLDDATKVYPGHGPATTIGEERRENPYLLY